MKYKIAIFDMDGTILDTLEDVADTLNAILREKGVRELTLAEVRRALGSEVRLLIRLALPEVSQTIVDETADEFAVRYADHCADKTRPYDGIVEAITYLRDHGVRAAVVSNKSDAEVRYLADQYFAGLFDYAIGETDEIRKKPYPDSVFDVLNKCGLQAEEAVYIGDTDVDILTGRNAGMDVICVTWGFRDEDFLIENGAVRLVHDIPEMMKMIEE